MGFLDELLDDPLMTKRRKLLEGLTVVQLKQFAVERNVQLKSSGIFSSGDPLRTKEEIVQKLWESTKEIPNNKVILQFKENAEPPTAAEKSEDTAKKAPPPMLTPTLAAAKTSPLVELDEVIRYVESYRFISRYGEEAFYEVELAGALRERFGTVIRQNPVAVPGKRLAIDLDVGGVGIEIKANLTAEKPLRDAIGQLADYRQFYGEKLIFLLVGTHGFDARKNEIRQTGVVFIEK